MTKDAEDTQLRIKSSYKFNLIRVNIPARGKSHVAKKTKLSNFTFFFLTKMGQELAFLMANHLDSVTIHLLVAERHFLNETAHRVSLCPSDVLF